MKAPKNEDQERQAAAAKVFAALLARTGGRWVGFAGGTDEMIAWQQGGREGGSFRA